MVEIWHRIWVPSSPGLLLGLCREVIYQVVYNDSMQETTFDKEREITSGGRFLVVGVDEAGRGPLAGPIVASAVCYRDPSYTIPESLTRDFALIRDSKKLSEKQREKIFDLIQEHFYVGVGIVHADTIDRINILEATFLAMKSAIASLKQQLTKNNQRVRDEELYVLIDGNQEIPNLSLKQETVVGGDGTVRSIAAASIIAKVTRDRMILAYDKEYPQYGLAQHKGYGTQVHMDALRKYGPSPIHRMSFKPVLLSIPENANRRFSNDLKRRKG
jgi:ribonuclease HII